MGKIGGAAARLHGGLALGKLGLEAREARFPGARILLVAQHERRDVGFGGVTRRCGLGAVLLGLALQRAALRKELVALAAQLARLAVERRKRLFVLPTLLLHPLRRELGGRDLLRAVRTARAVTVGTDIDPSRSTIPLPIHRPRDCRRSARPPCTSSVCQLSSRSFAPLAVCPAI